MKRLRRFFLAGTAMLILAWIAAPVAADFQIIEPSSASPLGNVIVLHGLNRSSSSMRNIAQALAAGGYRVVNLDYPSARYPVEVLTSKLHQEFMRCCASMLADGVHFVTHSLGGVLVRVWASEHPDYPVARSVMISPPSQGSELVDELKGSALFKLVTGPAGQQLGTDARSVPLQLGAVGFELGIITGRNTLNPLYSWLIPGEDDGKVSVGRAEAPGMADFLVVDENHTFIMDAPEVMAQTLHFLRFGRFETGTQSAPTGASTVDSKE